MFGFRMSGSEEEQLYLRHMFADAMERRAPMRVSFFREKKVSVWSPRAKRYVDKHTGMFVKVTRVVEPFAFQVAKDGQRSVLVVDRTPDGTWGPEYRTIRLDRVVVSRYTGKALASRMLSHGFMCPSPLDRRPLHPTKTVLTSGVAA